MARKLKITDAMDRIERADLDKYHICTRAGSHCAKILKDELKIKNTCRISLYFYNTKEEIDKLVDALNNPNIKTEII